MPTYEYHCDACDHHFDEFQSMSEKPLKKCPECKKSKLRRIFGAGAAIIFKGSGFYQTDYRSESYKAAAKADQDTGKAATTDKASSSETSTNGAAKTSNKKTGKSSKSTTAKTDD